MNEVAAPNGHTDLDRVMLTGDLSTITPKERIDYYLGVCRSVGLNPLTRPFDYIRLNGKTVLYAKRDCADQLRAKHNISIEIVDRKIANGLLTIHVRASMPDGRRDEDIGVVPWPENISPADASNLLMKCVTKAKRRVTLSIRGLGLLDESEVVDVPGAEFIEIDDAGEIRGYTPAQPKPKVKRKSSSKAKKDGDYDNLFKPIDEALDAANEVGEEACKEVWKRYAHVLEWFPADWHDLLAQKYMDAVEANGGEAKVALVGGKL